MFFGTHCWMKSVPWKNARARYAGSSIIGGIFGQYCIDFRKNKQNLFKVIFFILHTGVLMGLLHITLLHTIHERDRRIHSFAKFSSVRERKRIQTQLYQQKFYSSNSRLLPEPINEGGVSKALLVYKAGLLLNFGLFFWFSPSNKEKRGCLMFGGRVFFYYIPVRKEKQW